MNIGTKQLAHWTRAETFSLLLLSAAALAFEIDLTRLFSVAQFYHFAFMIVSIALLGYGASGTCLAIFPSLGKQNPQQSLGRFALGASASILGSYLLINNLPFDSFQIALDRKQAAILLIHYIALALPFFFSGLATGFLLSAYSQSAGSIYATNLVGSALGCGLALVCPLLLGGEGTVLLSSTIAALAVLVCQAGKLNVSWRSFVKALLSLAIIFFAILASIYHMLNGTYFPYLELRLSPYKSLSYALHIPGTRLVFSKWNSFSRVDRISGESIRSLPGLSYRYTGPLPKEDGLLVDGDELSPVISPAADPGFSAYLPAAIAFQLYPGGRALILEPRGGLDIFTALAGGAQQVTAVESNPLIIEAAGLIYQDPRVRAIAETDRSYTSSSSEQFDVAILSLASSYHPVNSGAYSLAEDYRYTVEAFQDILGRLRPNGLLVITRWLQTPPSECLRLFGIAVEALEKMGLDPAAQIVAFRGYNTGTILVSKQAFNSEQLATIRQFSAQRAFDLVYAPGILAGETNQYNVLPESIYYQAFTSLLNSRPREDFYRSYPREVSPPTDDRPFFGHFFKWSQAGQVVSQLGKTWQPFGGAGYFVILILLGLAILCAGILIVLPVAIARLGWRHAGEKPSFSAAMPYLCYFGLLGAGFMLVEIPMIQRFILFIGQPAYALAIVLFSLLFFSGIGSQLSPRIPLGKALGILALWLACLPFLLPLVFDLALGLSFAARLLITILALIPTGFLMGVPFARGILWMQDTQMLQKMPVEPMIIPWVWAINGAASVIASVLAALLAITFGFDLVFLSGALCYLGACLIVTWQELTKERRRLARLQHR